MMTDPRRWRRLLAVVALMSLLAACAADDGDAEEETADATEEAAEPTEDEPTEEEAEPTEDEATEDAMDEPTEDAMEEATEEEGGTAVSLAEVCPPTVTIQLDWEPEAEHGQIYELVGEGYEIDADAKSVTGPLVASGEETGVDVEVRIGGSPVGYQAAESLLYQDSDILLGFGRVAEMVSTYEDLPATAILTTFEKSPYAVYWDPETYPDVTSIADLGTEGVTILAGSGGDVWIDFLVNEGIVEESQFDTSDQEKPAAFIAAGGEVAEAGFATAEPFLYEVEVAEDWGRPVEVELIHDTGFPEYFQAVTVRSEDVEAQAPCLELLVPIIQQAGVDYVADPEETLGLIVELVETYDTGWVYTLESGEFAFGQMLELGIIGNGDDDVISNFDLDRVQELMDIVAEVRGTDVSGLTPEDLATNQFIDDSIGLP